MISASIDDAFGRVKLTLEREYTGRYQWYAQGTDDQWPYATEITGWTEQEAIEAARATWSGPWDLRIEEDL